MEHVVIQLHDAGILSTKSGHMDCLIVETIKLELQLNSMNRKDGLKLSNSWKPLIHLLKRKYHTSWDSETTAHTLTYFCCCMLTPFPHFGHLSPSIALPLHSNHYSYSSASSSSSLLTFLLFTCSLPSPIPLTVLLLGPLITMLFLH